MSKLVINAMFSKTVREPHRKTRTLTQNVVGIVLDGYSWPADYSRVKLRLQDYKPVGHALGGFVVISIDGVTTAPTA